MKLLILNGPNLNLLGLREPDIYGSRSYAALEAFIRETCREKEIECEIFQSNHEGALVDKIQEAYGVFDGIVNRQIAQQLKHIARYDFHLLHLTQQIRIFFQLFSGF